MPLAAPPSHVSHLFAVESDGGGRVNVLVEFEPVQHCGLARRVEADHGAVECVEVGQVSGRQRGQRILTDARAHGSGGETYVVAIVVLTDLRD